MKIVDATWEKRNLFLETKEITVEDGDTPEELAAALKEATEEYVVVKLPTLHTDKQFLLTEHGYTNIEVIIDFEGTTELLPLSAAKQKIFDQVDVVPMTEEQRKATLKLVSEGLFQTDRISLDPYFSIELSSRRYIGWLSDAVARGAEFWQLLIDKEPIGFFSVKQETPDTYNAFLSSIYTSHQGKGFGFLGSYKYTHLYIPRGAKRFVSQVSINNLKSLRRLLSGGRKITGFTYIYVKHNLPREEYWKRIEPHKDTLISEALSWIS